MARSQIVSNAKEFVKKLDDVSSLYHRGVLESLAVSADLARNRAVTEFMNPRSRKRTFHYEYWSPPPGTRDGTDRLIDNRTYRVKVYEKSDKLYIKSGRLADALQTNGAWNIKKNMTESRFAGSGRGGKHWLAWIRPQSSGNTVSYLLRMSLTEAGDPLMRYRILHEKGGAMRRDVQGKTWEERKQYRIPARPFLGPAKNKSFADNVYGAELFKRMKRVESVKI